MIYKQETADLDQKMKTEFEMKQLEQRGIKLGDMDLGKVTLLSVISLNER